LQVDAIRAYSYFDYSGSSKELILEYRKVRHRCQRATIDTLASQESYATGIARKALRTEKIAKEEIRITPHVNLQKILGGSFDKVYGKILEMGRTFRNQQKPGQPVTRWFYECTPDRGGCVSGSQVQHRPH
jgi:hypothetical protein